MDGDEVARHPPGRRRSPAHGSPPTGRRSPAGRPARPRSPARRVSRDIPASPARRGWPWGLRRRPPSVSDRAPRDRTRCRTTAPVRSRRRDGPRRSRRSRRPGCRPRARRASWPRPSSLPSRRRERCRQARARGLADRSRGRRRERIEGLLVEADQQPAGVDRDRRGDRARGADRRLGRPCDVEILRERQAVADQGQFEGDDRPARRQGGRDLGADVESVGEHRSVVA